MKKATRFFISIFLIIALMLPVIGFCFAASNFTTKSQFNGATYTHYGVYANTKVKDMIDVSEHNGLINFYKIKSLGIDDVIIRVGCRGYGSAGNIIEDAYYYDNIENAIDAGLNVGLYFYSQSLTTEEAKAEATYCIKRAEQYKKYINLPIFFDYEFAGVSSGRLDKAWNNGTLNKTKMTNNTIAFCDAVRTAGYKPGVYASASFYTDQLNSDKLYANGYEIWNAYYTKNSTVGNYWTNKHPVYPYWQYGGANVQGSCGAPDSAWLQVKYNGQTGYVVASFIDFTGATGGFSISDGLNLRKGPGTGYGVVTQIPFAGVVQIIKYPTGTNTDVNFYYYGSEGTVPAKPQFSLSAASTAVTVSWKSVTTVSYYRVYTYDTATKKYERIAQTSELSFTHTGLEKEKEYTYLVRAFNEAGGGSTYTSADHKSIVTAPAKPAFSLSAGTTSVAISWNAVDNAAYYRVYSYDSTTGKHTRIAQTSALQYTCTQLSALTQYTYLVRAFFQDGAGSLWTVADNQSIQTAGEAPAPLCTAKTADSITLSWEKMQGAQFYRVYSFNEQSGKYTRLGQTQAQSYTLSKLEAGTVYTFLVRAFVENNSASDYGKTNHLAVQTVPAKPQLTLKAYSYSVKLSWQAVKGAAFYRVYAYNPGTGKYTRLAETADCAWEHFSLNGNTEYSYLVRAFENGSYGSSYTKADIKSVKTCLNKPKFTLSAVSESDVKISWSKVSGAAYYRVYLYDAATGTYARVAQTKNLSFTYSKAAFGNTYTFLVRAFNAEGVGSSYSAGNNKSLQHELQKPAFTLAAAGKGSVAVTWQAVPFAAYYRVYAFDSQSGKYERLAQTKALSFTREGLESGSEVTLLVRAFSASGYAAAFTGEDHQSVLVR